MRVEGMKHHPPWWVSNAQRAHRPLVSVEERMVELDGLHIEREHGRSIEAMPREFFADARQLGAAKERGSHLRRISETFGRDIGHAK